MYCKKILAMLMITMFVLTFPPYTTTAAISPYNASVLSEDLKESSKHICTLITGDTLEVTRLKDGRYTIAIISNSSDIFKIIDDGEDTYVIPESVEQLIGDKLDIQLFNIDYLIENGYCDRDTLPIIIEYATNPGKEHAKINMAPGLLKKHDYEIIYASAAEVVKDNADDFANFIFYSKEGLEGVDKLWLDQKIRLSLDESVPAIGAPYAWAQGYDGSGIKVAILDTGIWKDHPDLIGKVVAENDFTEDGTPMDLNGHGTHCAGIVAANGILKGVAPGALLINAKVLGKDGTGQVSWAIKGFEWAAQQGAKIFSMSFGAAPTDGTGPMDKAINAIVEKYNIIAVAAAGNDKKYYTIASPAAADKVISVGATTKPGIPKLTVVSPEVKSIQSNLLEYSPKPPVEGLEKPIVYAGLGSIEEFQQVNVLGKIALVQRGVYTFKEKVKNAADAGAVAVIIFNNVPGNFYGSLTEPGLIPAVSISLEDGNYLLNLLANGEVIVNLKWDPEKVAIAEFSSRGPRLDHVVKPEIVAPGVSIKSTVPLEIDPSGYKLMSGTSMSAPHIAGAAALLLQKNPRWGYEQIRNVLMSTARIIGDYDVYTQGSGIVAIDHAMDANIAFTPAKIDFGKVPVADLIQTRYVTISNYGSTSATLELKVEKVHDISGNLYDIASLSQSVVTIPAGRTARIALTLNLTTTPINTPLGGRVIAEDTSTGKCIHAIFGVYRELTYELKIKMIDPNGSPWSGQTLAVWDIYSTEPIPFIYVKTNESGEAKLNLIPGFYNIFYYGRWGEPQWPIYTIYWLYAIEEPLFENKTVILDGRQAQPVTLNITIDQTIPRGCHANWFYKPSTVEMTYSFGYTAGHWRFLNYVLPAKANLGSLNMLFRFEEVRGKELQDLYPIKSPVLYDLFYTMVGEIICPIEYTVNETTLQKMALVISKYFDTEMNPRIYCWGSFAFATEFLQPGASSVWTRFMAPIERKEYLTPNKIYQMHVTPGELGPLTLYEPFRLYLESEMIEKTWFQQVMKPWALEARRSGNIILVRGIFTDEELHYASEDLSLAMNFELKVFKNNDLIYYLQDRYLWYQAVSPEVSEYTIELYSKSKPYIGGKWLDYSTETLTKIRFTSCYVQGTENLPIINLNYKIPALRLNNVRVTSKKDPLIIHVIPHSLKDLEISSVQFWYSYDDGLTWTKADRIIEGVDRWIVKIPSKEGYVSIKTLAIDVEGNSVEQTILRAFYVTIIPYCPSKIILSL
ncbi:MAG: S8 family serine peptidase [Candidatus Bathyarchaeia archaeon]